MFGSHSIEKDDNESQTLSLSENHELASSTWWQHNYKENRKWQFVLYDDIELRHSISVMVFQKIFSNENVIMLQCILHTKIFGRQSVWILTYDLTAKKYVVANAHTKTIWGRRQNSWPFESRLWFLISFLFFVFLFFSFKKLPKFVLHVLLHNVVLRSFQFRSNKKKNPTHN